MHRAIPRAVADLLLKTYYDRTLARTVGIHISERLGSHFMNAINPYEAPLAAQQHPPVNPGLRPLLFAFNGRIPRRQYWAVAIASFIVYGISISLIMPIVNQESAVVSLVGSILLLGVITIFTWVSLAIQIKRWHDRGKSGWWILISLIPVIGAIWAFIEVCCLRGTVGPNEFGLDPT
jgi:uncharacterized membrane protein YhaH (DUF805 family)